MLKATILHALFALHGMRCWHILYLSCSQSVELSSVEIARTWHVQPRALESLRHILPHACDARLTAYIFVLTCMHVCRPSVLIFNTQQRLGLFDAATLLCFASTNSASLLFLQNASFGSSYGINNNL